jgi:uncharacterized membrane protein
MIQEREMPRSPRLGRQLVVVSLATGLVLGGAVAAVVGWVASTSPAHAVGASVADTRREGDAFAEARRDVLAKSIVSRGGVRDVKGAGEPAHANATGERVVSLAVTMSPGASASQVQRVLDAAEESSRVLPRDHFLKLWPRTVVTLVTGAVSISLSGCTSAQAQAIVGLRDDPRVSSVRVPLSPAGKQASGTGKVTARVHDEASEVRATWVEQLAAAFPSVRSWDFD